MNLTLESLIENQRKISDLISSFKDAMDSMKCKDEVMDLLHKVSYYTEDFFINEELFLKKYQIPSFQMHYDEHKHFVNKMLEFHKRLEKNDSAICSDVMKYMQDWYNNHILDSDKQIIEYMKNRPSA